MFSVRYATPPQIAFLPKHTPFKISGTIKIVSRYCLSGSHIEMMTQSSHHEIVLETLKFLEGLPFCGRIGIAVRKGHVFLYGDIEAWNQQAEFRIDQVLMELEVFLIRFAKVYPEFRQTIALSCFSEPSPLF